MDDNDLATLVALTDLEGIGDKRALELYRAFGTGAELQDSPQEAFEDFHYVDTATYQRLQELTPTVEEYRERFQQYRADGIDVIGIDDDRYPSPLRRHHAPPILYAKGNLNRLSGPAVSVSGSRETNEAGRTWVRNVARELATEGYTVISGGARGADTGAHEGALEATGGTIVVLGTGINTPYPEENVDLFADIVDAGGLMLSHRPPDAEPNRYAFLDRNQTISALSLGTVIVATDGSGGTIAQYETALEQGRQVFVPEMGRGIQPDDGLEELRSAESTTVVSFAATILAEIADAQSGDDRKPTGKDHSVQEGDQTSLNEWGG